LYGSENLCLTEEGNTIKKAVEEDFQGRQNERSFMKIA
jgi:hypothetical protein